MSENPNAVCFDKAAYAGPIRRFFAFIIDLFLFLFAFTAIGLAIEMKVVPPDVMSGPRTDESQKIVNKAVAPYRPLLLAVAIALTLGTHILLPFTTGRTPGKLFTGTRMINASGEKPGLRALMRRFILAVPFCGFFGVAYIQTFKDDRRQAVHDRWSGTWVVKSNAEPRPAIVEYNHRLLGPFLLHFATLADADSPSPLESSDDPAVAQA